MRYYNYLNEGNDPDGYRLLIESNCSQFLKEWDGKPVYRGINKNIKFELLTTHPNRKPSNTLEDLQSVADMYFKRRFGWKCRSEHSLFGTGSIRTAETYGDGSLVVIFPLDGYKFVYSNNIKDFYTELMTFMADELDMTDDYPPEVQETYLEYKEEVDKYIEQMIKLYTDKDLKKAINSGNEIMFNTKKYIAINSNIFTRIFK